MNFWKTVLVLALAVLGTTQGVQAAQTTLGFPLPGLSANKVSNAWNVLKNNEDLQPVLKERDNAFAVSNRMASDELETVKFQHFYKGLEVVGSLALQQTSIAGDDILDRVARLDLSATPRLDSNAAVAIAQSLVDNRPISAKPELKILPEAEGSNARLVYWIDVDGTALDAPREVIIDANSGEIIGNISKHLELAPIKVYTAKNQGAAVTQLADESGKFAACEIKDLKTGKTTEITAKECQNLTMKDLPPNPCQVLLNGRPIAITPQYCKLMTGNVQALSDPAALRAAGNSSYVLQYYQTHHNRNSFDGRGTPTVSIVHGGIGFQNAFWSTDQNIMVYGEGDGKVLGDFTLALDVAGHEMTHGVVAYTAKLLGMGESGALNEATADFFGKMIANDDDWAIGRKLFINQSTAKGVRNLADPSQLSYCADWDAQDRCTQRKPFPSNIRQKQTAVGSCDSSNDNCWVHVNATIHGHALYLMTQAIGKRAAEKLYYATLTQSLTSRDTLITAAKAVKTTCTKMKQAFDPGTCDQVNQAFAQVGE